MQKTGFPIQAFGNDRSVVIPRSLEIVGNDKTKKAKDEILNQVSGFAKSYAGQAG